ncbi:MAG: YdbH domain-containing protein [Planctomycetes bacterium]|nr:YdbH domain-containing protein [Planctomycetota bacterium]
MSFRATLFLAKHTLLSLLLVADAVGTTRSSLSMPPPASLAGTALFHRAIPIDSSGTGMSTAVRSSNALALTIGSFQRAGRLWCASSMRGRAPAMDRVDRRVPAAAAPMSTPNAGTVGTPSAEGPRPALPRRRRWPWVVLVTATVVVAVVVLLAPRIVGSVLRAQLRQMGVGAVEIGAVDVGIDSLEIRDVRLASATDAGSITIRRALATFALGDLVGGRIATLVLDEPVWTMATDDRRSPFAPAAGDGAPDAAARPLPPVPIGQLTVRGGRILVATDAGPDAVTIDGVSTFGAVGWNVQLDTEWRHQTVHTTAEVRQDANRANGTLRLTSGGAEPIDATGSFQLEAVAGAPELTIALQKQPGPFAVVVAGGKWAGAGDVSVRAVVPMADLTKATLALGVEGLQLTSPTGARIDGIAAQAQFVGLPVPVTTTSQRVTWQAIRFGSFAGRAGHAELELHGDTAVAVAGVQQMGDGIGSIAVSGLRWSPGTDQLAATITAEDLSMREWLELLSGGKVTGEGRLDGNVALVVQLQPSRAVDLRSGQLVAAPGGVVRFLEKATAAQLLQVDNRAGAADPAAKTKADLVAALAEFVYTALDFRVEPEGTGSGVMLRVHAKGAGKGMTRPVEMDVNVRGFDQAIDTAVALEFGWQRMMDRIPRPRAPTKTPGKNQ